MLCKLNGVGEQIGEDLLQANRVRVNVLGRQRRLPVNYNYLIRNRNINEEEKKKPKENMMSM